jgi:WD40 repeat protein
MASVLILTGIPITRWTIAGRSPSLARIGVAFLFVAAWSGLAIAYWTANVGRWAFVPSEPSDQVGHLQVVCDDSDVSVSVEGAEEILSLNNPGQQSVMGRDLHAGVSYRLIITRGTEVLHTEPFCLVAGEQREINIPHIILAEKNINLKPSDGSFPSDVVRMQFSPDRSSVAVARLGGQILVFDAATGLERFTVRRANTHCLAFGFTPDSSRLVYMTPARGDSHVLRIVNVGDGHTVEPDLKSNGSWRIMNARALAFSPDGTRLAISSVTNAGPDNHWESGVFQWEHVRGEGWRELGFLDGLLGMIEDLRFTGDGSEVLAVNGTGLVMGLGWDSKKWSKRWDSPHSTIDVVAVGRSMEAFAGWSPEPKHASICYWKPGEVPELPVAKITSAVAFSSLSFSPGDRLLAAGTKGGANGPWEQLVAIRIWDVKAEKDYAILLGHTNWPLAIAFDPAGNQVVTTGNDGTVRTWRVP